MRIKNYKSPVRPFSSQTSFLQNLSGQNLSAVSDFFWQHSSFHPKKLPQKLAAHSRLRRAPWHLRSRPSAPAAPASPAAAPSSCAPHSRQRLRSSSGRARSRGGGGGGGLGGAVLLISDDHAAEHVARDEDLCLQRLARLGRAVVPVSKTGPVWPANQKMPARWPGPTEAGRGWPGLETALSLVWRWRGVIESELADASGQLFLSTECHALAATAGSRRARTRGHRRCSPSRV